MGMGGQLHAPAANRRNIITYKVRERIVLTLKTAAGWQ